LVSWPRNTFWHIQDDDVDRPIKDKIEAMKREEIIRVAGDLFYSKGFIKTSMEDIATALSVGKPFIYSHFASKADLLAEVCNRTTALAADFANFALDGNGTPLTKLREIVYQLCLRVIEGRLYLAVRFREEKHLPPNAVKELSRNYRSFNDAITRLLQEGIQTGECHANADAVVVTHALSGMTTWLYTWYKPGGKLSPEEIAEQMAGLVVNMIRNHDYHA
jgi:AcrR family transcriptional regulator